MKQLLFTILLAAFLFASCDRTTGSKTAKVPQREGIQWGKFISLDNGARFALPYRTADGTEDTLSCDLLDCNFNALGNIEEEDINFDGIPDVQICLGPRNHWGNFLYEGFVWNKEKGCFNWVENYHEIFSPEIHHDSLYILGADYFFFEGVSSTDFTKYEWIDGKLTETDSWGVSEGEMWDEDEEDDYDIEEDMDEDE
ncbi:MAG: hypothetical protein J6P73_03100 [Bacteroidales bacterium]|nr:hypothetical protein [Bacteroidales bacterium]